MSRKEIENFILGNLFNKDNVLYNSNGIDITRNWLSDHIEQVNRDGSLILRRACRSVQETKEIVTRTSGDLREILIHEEWLTTSGYMEKKAAAYLSWINDILEQLQRWSDFFAEGGRKTEQSILKRIDHLCEELESIKGIFQQEKNRVYKMIEGQNSLETNLKNRRSS